MQDPELWQKISTCDLGLPGARVPYSVRLSEEMRWPHSYTKRLLTEYKRYLYLTQIAAGGVSPSPEVATVCQHHSGQSSEYWDFFCNNVLSGPLPREGAHDDADMADQQRDYEATLALYGAEFGRTPPGDIWPDRLFGRDKVEIAKGVAIVALSLGFMVIAVAWGRGMISDSVGILVMMAAGLLAYAVFRVPPKGGRKKDQSDGLNISSGPIDWGGGDSDS